MIKYHMTKAEREVTDRAELQEVLKSGKFATIALCRDNEPYIVTLSCGYDEKNHCLYFHTAPKGLKLEFIKDNPRVCATVIKDYGYQKDHCSHIYSSVVLWGTMNLLGDLQEKKYAMDVLLNHLEDNPDPIKQRNLKNDSAYGGVALLKLDIIHMTGKKGS